MSNERIDLTQFEKIGLYVAPEWANLITELKRCYDLLDKIAEQAIPDNEDPELYGYVIDYEVIKSITNASE